MSLIELVDQKLVTCSNCLRGDHLRCSRNCVCSVCRRSPVQKKARVTQGSRTTLSKRNPPAKSEWKYGVRTWFTDAQVEEVFELKAAGKSIAEIARIMGVSRDRVRTMYNSPLAPALGVRVVEPEPYIVQGGPVSGNEHLDKAKAIIEAAREVVGDLTPLELFEAKDQHRQYMHFIDLASVQASLAQAEAMTRIAAALEQ